MNKQKIYIHNIISIYLYIYIYISLSIYIYIYLYIHLYISINILVAIVSIQMGRFIGKTIDISLLPFWPFPSNNLGILQCVMRNKCTIDKGI